MISSHRTRGTGRILLLGLVVLLAAPLGAETVLLDASVGSGPVVLDLHRAEVQVFIDPEGENFVQVLDPRSAESGEGSALAGSVRSERRDGALHVERLAGEEDEVNGPPDLRVDVVLTPGTPITVKGRRLQLVLEDTAYVARPPADEGAEEEDEIDVDSETSEEAPEPAPVLRADETARVGAASQQRDLVVRLEVERSQVEVWGLADVAAVCSDSNLLFEGTRERLLLEPQDCIVSVGRHRGALQARGEGGELAVDDVHGTSSIDWKAGEITLRQGEGKLTAHLEGSSLDFDGWRGDLVLEGDHAAIRGEDGRSSGRGLEVRGKYLDVNLGTWRGRLDMRLNGGQLGGGPWHGKLSVTALDGANVDLEPLFGELTLWLRGGASARLQGITGVLKAGLENSELDLDGISRNVEVEAKGSTLNLRGVEYLRKVRASSSEVSIDLAQLKNARPTFEALSGSRMRIDALAPCLVDINASSALDQMDLDVSGCEVKRLGEGRRGGRAPTRVDGAAMTRMVVRLSEDSYVEVEGR